MKTKLWKRGTSAVLAAVMCFSMIIGSVGTAVNAASGEKDAYMVSFPRDNDKNHDDEWGHENKTFMNGWSSHSTPFTTLHVLDDYEGSICYCIEPGTSRHNGDSLGEMGEDFWDEYPSAYNNTITPRVIKTLLGRLLKYGYTGDVSTSWVSQNEDDANNIAYAFATQILVWETIVGERDLLFNHVDSGEYDSVLSIVSEEHPLYDEIMESYKYIEDKMQTHILVPSFLSKSPTSTDTIELTWNGTLYEAYLTDTNGVLQDFDYCACYLVITCQTMYKGPVL